MKRSVWLAVFCSAVLVLSACSASGQESPAAQAERLAASGLDFTVKMDEETGRIDLPYDLFIPTRVEDQVLHNAAEAAAVLCWRELGLPATGIALRPNEIYLSEHLYGPWTIAQAQKFGFVEPAPDADLRANGYIPEGAGEPSVYDQDHWAKVSELNAQISAESAAKAEQECAADYDRWAGSYEGPWKAAMAQVNSKVDSSKEFEGIVDDLGACFEKRGFEPDDEYPYRPKGSDVRRIDEEQIELAVMTVGCRDEVDFTQRVADLYASFQALVMIDYEDELIDRQRELQLLLADAEKFAASHPEAFEIQ